LIAPKEGAKSRLAGNSINSNKNYVVFLSAKNQLSGCELEYWVLD